MKCGGNYKPKYMSTSISSTYYVVGNSKTIINGNLVCQKPFNAIFPGVEKVIFHLQSAYIRTK